MIRFPKAKFIVSIMQITLLVICMLACGQMQVSAHEILFPTTVPTEATTQTTVVTTTTETTTQAVTTTTQESTTVATTTVTTVTTTQTTAQTTPPPTVATVQTTVPTVGSSSTTGTKNATTTRATTTRITATTKATQAYGDVNDPNNDTFLQSLQDQRADIQKQALELQQARNEYNNSLDGLLKQKENIERQIALKQHEIDINGHLMDSITAQLYQTDEELIASEQTMLLRRQTLLERFEVLRQKLRALSKGGRLTPVQMLLGSDSFESFLINYAMASRISKADQNALNALESELASIREHRDELRLQQLQLRSSLIPHEAASGDLQKAKEELLALHAEATAIGDMLSQNVSYYQQQYTQLSYQQRYLQTQIASITGKLDMNGVIAPDIMSWPTPDCTIITSRYKARWGKWHYGLDIAGWGDSEGKPIYAAADGTVIFASGDDSGYGNYVMIDHGYDINKQRIITMYAHCSTLNVQVGDVVFGGQSVIANVGSTGRSTGPHLHFEVRVNGQPVDPIQNGYLSTSGITIAD